MTRFETRQYEFSHGSAPKNVTGIWAFGVGGETVVIEQPMTLREAKVKVATIARNAGIRTVTILP